MLTQTRSDSAQESHRKFFVQESAQVSDAAVVSDGCKVWDLAQVRENASLGCGTIVGRSAYIGAGVHVGRNCKIQNNALIYEPASVADGVFIGPAVVFTNDKLPRAINPDGTIKSGSDWTPTGVTCKTGASVGAGAVCIAPVTIGSWALVAAGSVVTKDVADFAIVAGNPARQIGWCGKTGARLASIDGRNYECPETGDRFVYDGKLMTTTEKETGI